jgi:hypothetical protein
MSDNSEVILAQGETFCFSIDTKNRDFVNLELGNPGSQPITVQIPLEVWHTIQQVDTRDFSLAKASDQNLLEVSEQMVNTRAAILEEAASTPRWSLTSLQGFEGLGDENAPRDVQVQSGLEAFSRRRAWERCVLERAGKHQVVQELANLNDGIWDVE